MWTSPDGQYRNQIDYILCSQRWRSSAAAAKLLQSCLTLCDPIDSSPPGSPIPGILQARTLEWVAIAFSREALTAAITRPGADCGSDHKLLITKFRLKLKKVGKTTKPFRYDLQQRSYDCTVELTNRFKGLDLLE